MAKREIKGNEFTKCQAFWECNEGETFTGVLVDCNERFPDKMKGPNATKPLYILKSLAVKGEKPSLALDDKPVKNEKGLIVGVFDTGELSQKIMGHYQELLGCEITISFTKKEPFTASNGAARTIKRFTVMADDQKHTEFGKDAVQRQLGVSKPASGETPVPWEEGDAAPS